MVEFFRICYQVSSRRARQKLPAPRSTLHHRYRQAKETPY
jgi:hypothetical protein